MRHSYDITCTCVRCVKERGRRVAQAQNNPHNRTRRVKPKVASREEQHARYIDCGPSNWDDR